MRRAYLLKGEMEGNHRIELPFFPTPSSDDGHAVKNQTKVWTRGGAMMTVVSSAVLLTVLGRAGWW